MRLSASIVLYNNPPEMVTAAIRSFLEDYDGTLVVVDNSPTPAGGPHFQQERVHYLHNGQNIGFGPGHNVAIELMRHKSDIHLILNPDIHFERGTLPHLASVLEADPSIGAIMPRIQFPDGSTQHLAKLLPTPVDLLLRRFLPFPGLRELLNKRYELHEMPMDGPREVPSISGCFLMARMSILERINGFDPRYFMYMEDVDLIRRIGDHGRIIYDPRVSVTHEYGKGSYKNPKLLKYHMKSAIKYFFKWGWMFDGERARRNRATLQSLS